jgi:signal transduction histidine kinase
MGVSRQQMLALVLLVALPFCTAALTAIGLMQLDRILDKMAEEYGEARLLEPIDQDLESATTALQVGASGAFGEVRRHLVSAEAALVAYLATQYDDVGSEEHQAVESDHASTTLARLREILLLDFGSVGSEGISAAIRAVRLELGVLLSAADSGVREAHGAATQARSSTLSIVFVSTLVSTGLCLALLVWSTRSVNRRLRDLHRRLAATTQGSAGPRASDTHGMVTQIESMNASIIARIEETGRELLRRERLAGIGLLAADVAHEINNPMNAMLGLSELGLATIERGPLDESARAELEESLRVMRRESLRCKGIVERLMAMVRSDRSAGWFDATRLIRETVGVARAARPDKAAAFVVIGDRLSVRAYGPADDVRQILLTLLINAADAIQADGRIEVDAVRSDEEICLRVRDDGRGFTEAMRETFFTPFKSYGEKGRGLGLGLSIAQAIAEGMGATIRPSSDGPGRGSMFVLAMPLREPPS